MTSRRLFGVLVLSLACATPALADVTLKQKSGGQGMAAAAAGETTQYVKGLRIRTDQTIGGNQTSTIIDASKKQMFIVNHGKKEVDVIDMSKMAEGLSKIPINDIKATVTPT